MLKTIWQLLGKFSIYYIGLFAFAMTLWSGFDDYRIYKHGDIVYATIIEDPYISRKECKALLQYNEFKSVFSIGTWGLCNNGKYKKGDTIPVRYLRGYNKFIHVSSVRLWLIIPLILFITYLITLTIKEHIKFFREEREKKQNTT